MRFQRMLWLILGLAILIIGAGSWICQVNGMLGGEQIDDSAKEKIVEIKPQQASFGTVSGPKTKQVDQITPASEDPEEKSPSLAIPDRSVCEDFEVIYYEKNGQMKRRFKRNRKDWGKKDRARFKQLVHLVATEMNAEPRIFEGWSLRESTLNPSVIHLLNPDLEGATNSWQAHEYSKEKEAELLAKMEEVGARDPKFWKAKAKLHKIRKFQNNPYFDDKIEFKVTTPTETLMDSMSSWSYGYGAFGMNPTLYQHIWDPEAPPWIFCSNEGIPAIVTAVWAARSQQEECQALGWEGTYRDINRRFGTGHCKQRKSLNGKGKVIRKYAKRTNLDLDEKAKLGCRKVWKKGKRKKVKVCKWDEETTDRYEIVEYMTKRAQEKGIL